MGAASNLPRFGRIAFGSCALVAFVSSGIVVASYGAARNDPASASSVATAQKPAEVVPRGVASSDPKNGTSVLRLTLRPTATDPNIPFLVQVFANAPRNSNQEESSNLLGTVSFFPVKIGKTEDFVLPAPNAKHTAVAVKLIPANSTSTLKMTSVEVVDAQFTK